MLRTVLLFVVSLAISTATECYPRKMDHGIVCVCNQTHWDEILPIGPLKDNVAVLTTTSKGGKRFHRTEVTATSKSKGSPVKITLNLQSTKQTMMGFGGAFTDSVGMNMKTLPESMQNTIINQYFHPDDGLGYTFGRVPIASCDFSTHEYSYAESPLDFTWMNFSLAREDLEYKIPYIKQAQKALGDVQLKLFATPWSPPGWMKNTGKMVGGGEMLGDMNGKYYTAYPQYFVKFFEQYHQNGVDFWGLTPQNEPTSGIDPFWKWQTMLMTAGTQRDFIKKHLGPAIRANPVTKNINIMINDDQRYNMPFWPDTILADPGAAQYVNGIGLHWYQDMVESASVLTTTHNRHPDHFLLATEASAGYLPAIGPKLGDWARAEEYAGRIMSDLQNWVAGFVDWNLILDMTGGPNFAKNFIDAAIIVNASATEYYKQPIWHVIGQFSKFVRPGAVLVEETLEGAIKSVQSASFINPDGSKVVIVLNKSLLESHLVELVINPTTFYEFRADANSITTVVFK